MAVGSTPRSESRRYSVSGFDLIRRPPGRSDPGRGGRSVAACWTCPGAESRHLCWHSECPRGSSTSSRRARGQEFAVRSHGSEATLVRGSRGGLARRHRCRTAWALDLPAFGRSVPRSDSHRRSVSGFDLIRRLPGRSDPGRAERSVVACRSSLGAESRRLCWNSECLRGSSTSSRRARGQEFAV